MKWLAFAALIAVLCGETAYILMEGANNGSGLTWRPLSAPPERAARITWVGGGLVVVETVSHNYYRCITWPAGKCWEAVKIDQFQGLRGGTVWQPSSELAPPPLPRAIDIQYVLDPTPAEFVIFAAYAIEDDGTVLEWRHSSSLIDYFIKVLPPICGATFGLVGMLILAALVKAWPKAPVKHSASVSRLH